MAKKVASCPNLRDESWFSIIFYVVFGIVLGFIIGSAYSRAVIGMLAGFAFGVLIVLVKIYLLSSLCRKIGIFE